MQTYGGSEVTAPRITPALDGGDWLASRPDRFILQEKRGCAPELV
jgi:hypothetical protein